MHSIYIPSLLQYFSNFLSQSFDRVYESGCLRVRFKLKLADVLFIISKLVKILSTADVEFNLKKYLL